MVLDNRLIDKESEYLVKWKGLTSEYNSWVSEKDFDEQRIIHDYRWYKKIPRMPGLEQKAVPRIILKLSSKGDNIMHQ